MIKRMNAFCMTDFYKMTHLLQYDNCIAQITSYMTPRSSRLRTTNKITMFGLTDFVNTLDETFRSEFFERDFDTEIAPEVSETLRNGLGYGNELIDKTLAKLKTLHNLGYLPVSIRGVPEGTRVPMGVPMVEVTTTDPRVPWIGQAIESWMSCALWHPCVSATVAFEYAKIAAQAYQDTVDIGDESLADAYRKAFCDFSMRGQESYESAVASSAAWLTAFYNSSTVEARGYVQQNYEDGKHAYIGGLTSTEHSVMTTDAILNGMDERKTYKRLLTEVYPDTSFAAVCDSYDFWNVLVNILPTLKDELAAHKGFMGIRHDSADPVIALCGRKTFNIDIEEGFDVTDEDVVSELIDKFCREMDIYSCFIDTKEDYLRFRLINEEKEVVADKVAKIVPIWESERGVYTDYDYEFVDDWDIESLADTTYVDKGMVETMWEIFGGTVNSKGYKVVWNKVKAVYGDSITIERAREIFTQLRHKGFAANNVSLGVGSFSMECIEENGSLKPFTRDTFSIAIKATHMSVYDEMEGSYKAYNVYKDPKGFYAKKSIKGYALVYYDENGNLTYRDQVDGLEYTQAILHGQDAFFTYYEGGDKSEMYFGSIRERVAKDVEKEIGGPNQ
jgi:nicotinamide phosphoribosyltransferase